MYRLILQDYRSHWRSSLKRLYDNGSFSVWLLGYFVFSNITAPNEELVEELQFLCLALPCYIAFLLARMYGGYFNKTFFLCPLDSNGRQEYLKQSLRLRIIISTVIFIIMNTILLIANRISFIMFLLSFFVFMCTAISTNIYCQPMAQEAGVTTTRYPLIGDYETINIYSHVFNILNIIILSSFEDTVNITLEIWEMAVIGFLFVAQLLICYIKVKRYYWQIIIHGELYN